MRSGVYAITSPSGKKYVGSAVNIDMRWNQHRHSLREGKHHCYPLQAASNKYGLDNLIFEVIILAAPINVVMYEQIAMDALKPEYNVCKVAGSPLGHRHTAETKAKMSAAQTGRQHSDETKAKIAASNRRRGVSEATKEKMRAANLGKTTPEHVKEKLSAALTGRKRSEENKENLRASWTPERRAAHAAARLGKKSSPEAIAKRAAGIKASWDRRKAAAAAEAPDQ